METTASARVEAQLRSGVLTCGTRFEVPSTRPYAKVLVRGQAQELPRGGVVDGPHPGTRYPAQQSAVHDGIRHAEKAEASSSVPQLGNSSH